MKIMISAIEVVREHLIGIHQGYIGLSEQLPVFLERIFELHSIDKGIKEAISTC